MPVATCQQEGKRALPATAAALRLARARALLQLGRLDDASIILQRLSGACSHETRQGLSYCRWGIRARWLATTPQGAAAKRMF